MPDFRVAVLARERVGMLMKTSSSRATPEVIETVGIPNADQARDENRMFWMPGYEEKDGTIRILQGCASDLT
jgi:hypothetical protein